jgi:hypothetical protein
VGADTSTGIVEVGENPPNNPKGFEAASAMPANAIVIIVVHTHFIGIILPKLVK